MGFMRLGALSLILSDTLVSGFSTGCAVHVATSQLNSLFDISVPKRTESVLKLVYVCSHLFYVKSYFSLWNGTLPRRISKIRCCLLAIFAQFSERYNFPTHLYIIPDMDRYRHKSSQNKSCYSINFYYCFTIPTVGKRSDGSSFETKALSNSSYSDRHYFGMN